LAKQETVTLYDDLARDQEIKADETVWFSLDGTDYEIDLTFSNAADFRKVMAPYTEAGRKTAPVRRNKTRNTASRNRAADIRRWAKAAGREIPERGRIPATIVAEYDAHH
jgi:hypothetical protein